MNVQVSNVEGLGSFRLLLGGTTNSKMVPSACTLVSNLADGLSGVGECLSHFVAPLSDNSLRRAQQALSSVVCSHVAKVDEQSLLELMQQETTTRYEIMLLNMLARETPRFWGKLLASAEESRRVPFVLQLSTRAMMADSSADAAQLILNAAGDWTWNPSALYMGTGNQAPACTVASLLLSKNGLCVENITLQGNVGGNTDSEPAVHIVGNAKMVFGLHKWTLKFKRKTQEDVGKTQDVVRRPLCFGLLRGELSASETNSNSAAVIFASEGAPSYIKCRGEDPVFISPKCFKNKKMGKNGDLVREDDIVSFVLDLDMGTLEVHINSELAFKLANFKSDIPLYPYVRCHPNDTIHLLSGSSYYRQTTPTPALRLCLSNLVAWLATTWTPDKDKDSSGVFAREASMAVLNNFTESLREVVENAENATEMEKNNSALCIKTFMTRTGTCELIRQLFLLGYAINARQTAKSKDIRMLRTLAYFVSVLDRGTVFVSSIRAGDENPEDMVLREVRPMCQVLFKAVGQNVAETIWAKHHDTCLGEHVALFGGCQLSNTPAFEELLERDSKHGKAKLDSLIQAKIAVHMSPFLDDLERHTIIAILYHSGVLAMVVERDPFDLDDETMAVCRQASLQARTVRCNVMEMRSRHNQTLQEDEEPKSWDFFTLPYVKKCLLLLRFAPLRVPHTLNPASSTSPALAKFRGAAAKAVAANAERRSAQLEKNPSDPLPDVDEDKDHKRMSQPLSGAKALESAWDMMLGVTIHTHAVYKRLHQGLLYQDSTDHVFSNISTMTKFVLDQNLDPEKVVVQLHALQEQAENYKTCLSIMAYNLLHSGCSVKAKLKIAHIICAKGSRGLGRAALSTEPLYRPIVNTVLLGFIEMIPHDPVFVRALVSLLSKASIEDGAFLSSTSIFKTLEQTIDDTQNQECAEGVADITTLFLLHVGIWKENCNPLFAKYTQKLLCHATQRLADMVVVKTLITSDRLVHIGQALTLLVRSASVDLVSMSNVFMDTVWFILERIRLDAPRLAFLELCQILIKSPDTHESMLTTLSSRLHCLVTVSSPEYSVMTLGSSEQSKRILSQPSVAVRAYAARCLWTLAAHPSLDKLLLDPSLGNLLQQEDFRVRDFALVLSLGGTLDTINLPNQVVGFDRSCATGRIRAKILEVCKTGLHGHLLFERDRDGEKMTVSSLRDLVFSVRCLHAIKELLTASHAAPMSEKETSAQAAEILDEKLVARLIHFATLQTRSAPSPIPSSRNLEDIISKTYAVLESKHLILQNEHLIADCSCALVMPATCHACQG